MVIDNTITYKDLKERILGDKIPEILLDDILDNATKLIKVNVKRFSTWEGKLYINNILNSMTETVSVNMYLKNDSTPSIVNVKIWVDKNEVHVVKYIHNENHETKIYEMDLFKIIKELP